MHVFGGQKELLGLIFIRQGVFQCKFILLIRVPLIFTLFFFLLLDEVL